MSNGPTIQFEQLWLKWCKLKHPTIVIGSQHYNELRKAFYCGAFVFCKLLTNTPNAIFDHVMPNIMDQIESEIKREDKEVLTPRIIIRN